eukprot:365743-Chlamydomonas_euryale.AAC.21
MQCVHGGAGGGEKVKSRLGEGGMDLNPSTWGGCRSEHMLSQVPCPRFQQHASAALRRRAHLRSKLSHTVLGHQIQGRADVHLRTGMTPPASVAPHNATARTFNVASK